MNLVYFSYTTNYWFPSKIFLTIFKCKKSSWFSSCTKRDNGPELAQEVGQ